MKGSKQSVQENAGEYSDNMFFGEGEKNRRSSQDDRKEVPHRYWITATVNVRLIPKSEFLRRCVALELAN